MVHAQPVAATQTVELATDVQWDGASQLLLCVQRGAVVATRLHAQAAVAAETAVENAVPERRAAAVARNVHLAPNAAVECASHAARTATAETVSSAVTETAVLQRTVHCW
eukprot:TRINITY_DN280_c0_g1_i15.p3 TRINITY_DN280_c0_g1~~TRINITY_DN280_c0_g1_i15.p3  ORF type:complete len:110 (-),score=23.02 TRINITY_DN280_c0_g1_i15:218-547(-)